MILSYYFSNRSIVLLVHLFPWGFFLVDFFLRCEGEVKVYFYGCGCSILWHHLLKGLIFALLIAFETVKNQSGILI